MESFGKLLTSAQTIGLPVSATSSLSSTTTAQGQVTSATSSASPNVQSTNDKDASQSSGGLSSGGKIGIAISMALLGTVLIASILVFFSHRKRKQKDAENIAHMNSSTMRSDKSQADTLQGNSMPRTPNGQTQPVPDHTVSPISPLRSPPGRQENGRPSAFAELDGEKGSVQELHDHPKSMYEMPSQRS